MGDWQLHYFKLKAFVSIFATNASSGLRYGSKKKYVSAGDIRMMPQERCRVSWWRVRENRDDHERQMRKAEEEMRGIGLRKEGALNRARWRNGVKLITSELSCHPRLKGQKRINSRLLLRYWQQGLPRRSLKTTTYFSIQNYVVGFLRWCTIWSAVRRGFLATAAASCRRLDNWRSTVRRWIHRHPAWKKLNH